MLIALPDIQAKLNRREYNDYVQEAEDLDLYFTDKIEQLSSLVDKNGFAIFRANKTLSLLSIVQYMRKTFGPSLKDSGIAKKYLARVAPNSSKKFYINSSLAQPLHTDEGYRKNFPHYTSLYCIEPDLNGGVSVLVDGRELIEHLRLRYKELIALAFDNNFMHLETAVGELSKALLFHMPDGSVGISYSPILKQIHSSADGLRLISAVNEYIHDTRNQLRIKLRKNELLVMNNCRMLHGRTEFDANNQRLLVRLWNGEMKL